MTSCFDIAVGIGLLALSGSGCARTGAVPVAPIERADEAAAGQGVVVLASTELEQVGALACDAGGCVAVVDGAARPLDPVTLALGEPLGPAAGPLWATDAGWATLLPCPTSAPEASRSETCTAALSGGSGGPVATAPSDVPDRIDQLGHWWNARQAANQRIPFATTMPTTDGRAVTWMRGDDPTSSRLILRGGGMHAAPAPGVKGAIAYSRTVALHPTGQELYVLVWPQSTLAALTPATMGWRWEVDLPPAAHGLFVDPTGRWLVSETGGDGDPARLLDFDSDGPSLPEGAAIGGDAWLALADRPDAANTTVVDLATHGVGITLPGRFRGWTTPAGSDDVLLATSTTIVRFQAATPGSEEQRR